MRPQEDPARPLPLVATAIVLGAWVVALLVVAFVVVPFLFSLLGPR